MRRFWNRVPPPSFVSEGGTSRDLLLAIVTVDDCFLHRFFLLRLDTGGR